MIKGLVLEIKWLRHVASITLSLALSATACEVLAVPEAQLPEFNQATLQPFYLTGAPIDFTGARSLHLRGRAFTGPKSDSVIVIVPGWTEPARKYAELIWDLNQLGYSVFIMDHRGQGESARPIDCGFCSYVDSYKDYIQDLETFVTEEVKPRGPWKKVILLAHSMGGGIATAALQNDPTLADAAILMSPMDQINTSPYPGPVAQSLIEGAVLAGKGKERRLFDSDKPDTFANNITTHSAIRWDIANQLGIDHPELRVDFATNRWLQQMFEMTNVIRLTTKKFTRPVLLIQAGQDQYVMNPVHAKICDSWPNCRLYTVDGAKHEVLEEIDSLRDEAFSKIEAFLKAQTE